MFVPQNESGVVAYFMMNFHLLEGASLISIQTQFPDAILEIGDQEIRVEFEYRSSNFWQHGHDPRGCDVIVCWENDWQSVLPIIELGASDWSTKLNGLPNSLPPQDHEKEIEFWKYRAIRAENRLGASGNGVRPSIDNLPEDVIEGIRELARNNYSNRAIEQSIFGYSGGAAYHIVRAVLNDAKE